MGREVIEDSPQPSVRSASVSPPKNADWSVRTRSVPSPCGESSTVHIVAVMRASRSFMVPAVMIRPSGTMSRNVPSLQ